MITIMNEPWPGLVPQQIICANTDLDFAILSHIFLFLDGGDYLFYFTLPSYFMDIYFKMFCYGPTY